MSGASFVDHFCHLCFAFVFVIMSCLFLAVLWSPTGKQLTSWPSCMLCSSFVFVTFPSGVLGQVWYLVVSVPDICLLPYSEKACGFYMHFQAKSGKLDTIRLK